MKRYGTLVLLLFFISIMTAYMVSAAEIKGSKHDLSMPVADGGTGPGPIQSAGGATGTKEICVFCHTPHNARPDAPLWNRSMATGPYTVYTSDVLDATTGLGIIADDPSNSSSAGYAVHVKTRICLSCHDGTIALGTLVNMPGDLVTIAINNSNAGKIPNTAAGYLGTDLSDDHPVAIKQVWTGLNSDPELKSPAGTRVRLYNNVGGKIVAKTTPENGDYVECTSCHDAHDNQYGNFLVGQNDQSKLCLNCHTKSLGAIANSAHDNANNVPYSPPTNVPPSSPYPTTYGTYVSDVKCMTCHYMHRAGATGASPPFTATTSGKYLLSFQEENTCFNNHNRWTNPDPVTVCHGSGATNVNGKNLAIQTEVEKTSAHRVEAQSGIHGSVEVRSATVNGWFNSTKWHVECEDCHNPHTAGNGVHSKGTNTIDSSSSLYGVSYARVSGGYPGGSWNAPVTYSPVEPLGATNTTTWAVDVKEYEICFKCHSYFAFQGSPSTPTPPSGGSMTDQSLEFNATASYHPVVTSNPNTYGAYVNGWSSGTQLMYCSDCHTKEGSNARPQGAHGSTNPFILSKQYFDDKANYLSGDDSASTFCMDCHDWQTYVYGGTGSNTGFSGGGVNLHTQHALRAYNHAAPSTFAYRCVNCHIRIPHGWQQRKGMIFVQGDIPGTAYAPVSGPTITWASLPAPGSYALTKNSNCMTITGCHQ